MVEARRAVREMMAVLDRIVIVEESNAALPQSALSEGVAFLEALRRRRLLRAERGDWTLGV